MVSVLLVVGGYVLGSMPWGLWLVRIFRGEDIRTVGSGNIGASNVWRVYGRRLGLPAVLLDTAKGFVPAFARDEAREPRRRRARGRRCDARPLPPALPALPQGREDGRDDGRRVPRRRADRRRHRRRCLAPRVRVDAIRVGRVGHVSPLSLPLWAWLIGYPWPVVAFAGAAGLGVLLLHRANLTRLWRGEEPRFTRAASL